MTDESTAAFDYDVALSFAGEDRPYVHDIAERLRNHGVRVFYDQFAIADTWGAELNELLDEIYRKKARFTVAFISSNYAAKSWPTHERRSALARALSELGPYFLPVRLDSTELPGLRPTVGFVDAQSTTPDELVQLILQKLERPIQPSPSLAAIGVPRTPEQQRRLLDQRPPGWEYLLFAGFLAQGKDALEPKWRDHQLRYTHPSGISLDDSEAMAFHSAAMNEAQGYAGNVIKVLNRQTTEWAFGAPGMPGDPANIEYLGKRLVGIYEDFLDWSARIRGATTSADLRRLFEITARFMDTPISQIRDFIDNYVSEAERLPEKLASDDDTPITMTFELVLSIDDRTVAESNRELKRLRRRRFLR
jgi:TIR domain